MIPLVFTGQLFSTTRNRLLQDCITLLSSMFSATNFQQRYQDYQDTLKLCPPGFQSFSLTNFCFYKITNLH